MPQLARCILFWFFVIQREISASFSFFLFFFYWYDWRPFLRIVTVFSFERTPEGWGCPLTATARLRTEYPNRSMPSAGLVSQLQSALDRRTLSLGHRLASTAGYVQYHAFWVNELSAFCMAIPRKKNEYLEDSWIGSAFIVVLLLRLFCRGELSGCLLSGGG